MVTMSPFLDITSPKSTDFPLSKQQAFHLSAGKWNTKSVSSLHSEIIATEIMYSQQRMDRGRQRGKNNQGGRLQTSSKARQMKIIFGGEIDAQRPAIGNDCRLPSADQPSGQFVCFDHYPSHLITSISLLGKSQQLFCNGEPRT